MAKVKSYMNPNIPKPKPGDSNDETRYVVGGPGWREINFPGGKKESMPPVTRRKISGQKKVAQGKTVKPGIYKAGVKRVAQAVKAPMSVSRRSGGR